MWVLRHLVMYRAIQLRLNPFLMDTDLAFTGDVYAMLHTPPLDQFNVVQAGAYSFPGLNTGAVYFHNVNPQGPVAWVLQSLMQRALFVLLDVNATYINSRGKVAQYFIMDQTLFNEAICAITAGFVIHPHTGLPAKGKSIEEYMDAHEALCPSYLRNVTLKYPEAWLPRTLRRSEDVAAYHMTYPFYNATWFQDVSALPFIGTLKPYFERVMQITNKQLAEKAQGAATTSRLLQASGSGAHAGVPGAVALR